MTSEVLSTDVPEIVLQARTPTIADLIQQCADGELPFSGPDSLCAKVAAMGFKTTNLYGMVRAAEAECFKAAMGGKQAPLELRKDMHALTRALRVLEARGGSSNE